MQWLTTGSHESNHCSLNRTRHGDNIDMLPFDLRLVNAALLELLATRTETEIVPSEMLIVRVRKDFLRVLQMRKSDSRHFLDAISWPSSLTNLK